MTTLDYALYYHSMGWSTIPVSNEKIPLIPWSNFRQKRASLDEIIHWHSKQFPVSGIALVTGSLSGVVVVDIEAGGSLRNIPKTPYSRSGGGGFHFYFRHPGFPFRCSVSHSRSKRALTDIRGDGDLAILPPSSHISGREYHWIVRPTRESFAPLPEWVFEMVPQRATIQTKPMGKRPLFSRLDIENIKKIPLSKLLEQDGITLQKKGVQFVSQCPFHRENTPSCVIYENTNELHCFGCGQHMDGIGYVQKSRGLPFIQAIEYLSKSNL